MQQDYEQALSGGVYQAAWRYSWRLAKSTEDAEDLLQDALIHAFEHFHQVKDMGKFKGWVLSIVRSTYLMKLRRETRRPMAFTGFTGTLIAPDQPESTYPDLPPDLMAALLTLPKNQQEVLDLYYFDQLEISEISQVLKISVNSVKVRLHRARKSLELSLEEIRLKQASSPTWRDKDGTA